MLNAGLAAIVLQEADILRAEVSFLIPWQFCGQGASSNGINMAMTAVIEEPGVRQDRGLRAKENFPSG